MRPEDIITDAPEVSAAVRSVPSGGWAPYMQGLVFVQHGGRIHTPLLRGVDVELEKEVSRLPQHIIAGTFDMGPKMSSSGRIWQSDLA